MKHGFILGKFDPLHQGHFALIESAREQCERLTILVYDTNEALAPGWQRYHWVKNTWPDLNVIHCVGGVSQAFRWMENQSGTEKILFDGSGKWKGGGFSEGILYQMVGNSTETQVSTSHIREAPNQHLAQIMPVARPFFIQRIALIGPESCGKSYLAEKLAVHFQTVFVEEYGRTYCEKFGMDSTDLDFAHVAGGQLYREDEMALQANRVLFCDTELIVTQVWSEVYFQGKCQPWIFWANHERRYTHFLLCAPDIPWVNDGLREFEQERQRMFERLRQEMESRQLPYTVIAGSYSDRWDQAVKAVELVISEKAG
ncbi:MAG: AAA family ATPase [Saprospiraceae bacterium]|nr:AAA family ATPase [Saprospiraceae bacterium]